MKLELTSTSINKLFNRQELFFKVDENYTPSRANVRREIAVLMRTDPDCVVVRSLETRTGSRVTIGNAHVYSTKDYAEKIEPKHLLNRNNGKQAVTKTNSETTESPKEEKK